MKNKIIIKEKRSFSLREKKNVILTAVFTVLSLVIGFLIAELGNGESYVETELITAIITLFGFSLTATVFVYQAFENSQSNDAMNVIKAISKTLLLTLCLVIVALVLDFIISIIESVGWCWFLGGLKYAALVYSAICQFDILNSFIVIINITKKIFEGITTQLHIQTDN